MTHPSPLPSPRWRGEGKSAAASSIEPVGKYRIGPILECAGVRRGAGLSLVAALVEQEIVVVAAFFERGAEGEQCMCLRRAAVVGEWRPQRIGDDRAEQQRDVGAHDQVVAADDRTVLALDVAVSAARVAVLRHDGAVRYDASFDIDTRKKGDVAN